MGIASTQASQHGSEKPAEGNHWVAAECAEEQIEPDDVGPHGVEALSSDESRSPDRRMTSNVERKSIQLVRVRGDLIRQNGEVQKWISLQFASDMKPVFA